MILDVREDVMLDETVGHALTVVEGVCVGELLLVPLPLPVEDTVIAGVTDADAPGERLAVGVAALLGVMLLLGVNEPLSVMLLDGDGGGVATGVPVGVGEPLTVALLDGDDGGVAAGVSDALAPADSDDVGVAALLGVPLPVGVGEPLAVSLPDGDDEAVAAGVEAGLTLADCDGVSTLSGTVGDGDVVPDTDGEPVGDGVSVPLPV